MIAITVRVFSFAPCCCAIAVAAVAAVAAVILLANLLGFPGLVHILVLRPKSLEARLPTELSQRHYTKLLARRAVQATRWLATSGCTQWTSREGGHFFAKNALIQ